MSRLLPRAVALTLVATMFVAACGDDHDHATTSTSGATAEHDHDHTSSGATGSGATAASGATTTAAASGATVTVAGTLVEVTYKGGKVEGGGRKQVAKGQNVTLRVTSDVADEVHLHGYDKEAALVAGQATDIVFKADASGVFEVELHKKGLKLVEIEVR